MRKGITAVATFGLIVTHGAAEAQVTAFHHQPTHYQEAHHQGVAQTCDESNELPPAARYTRAGGGIVGYLGGRAVLKGVGGAAQNAATFGKVRDVPKYGAVAKNVPLIGAAAGSVPIVPTTLGDAPIIGKVITDIPVVGNVVGGTPPPWLVGAVAIDTYVLPKVAPCGYTESSMFAQTDFNSPPRLRHYKNYLAPLPYTHPPIYEPGTLNTGQPLHLPDVGIEGPPVEIEH